MDVPDPLSDPALEDLAYLSRSSTRARILAALSQAAATRGELESATGIARTTLDRVVTELEERDWIERTRDGQYAATPVGERIAAESTRVVEAFQAIRTLGDAVAWLPEAELTVGLHEFRGATVRRPEPNAMNAPATFATALLREATEFACLVNTPPSLAFEEAMIAGVAEGRLATNHVITEGELDVLREDPDRAARWRSYVEAGAELYCYEGAIPCNLLVIDATVLVLDRQPDAPEGIESSNPAVRNWATGLIEDYLADAKRLEAAAFA